ncbi:MAG: hypothetical protein AAF215_24505 [Cyanobacteria bacterium P01_A01_bin.123]
MKFSQLKPTLLFLTWVILLTSAIGALKVGITWASETHLYSIPIVGGLLKSLEIVELSNILVFALLGLGLGMTTIFLSYLHNKLKVLAILLVMMVLASGVFCLGYATRQHIWIQQVADEASISFAQAKTVTNDFLTAETGSNGFWGFYRYTTQVPILPIKTSEIASLTDDEKWFRSELTRFSGLEPGIFSRMFSIAGWGIRGFYMALAGFTFIIYYFKGLDWVEHRRIMRRPLPTPEPRTRPASVKGKTTPRPVDLANNRTQRQSQPQRSIAHPPQALRKVVRPAQTIKRSPHASTHSQGKTQR